MRGTRATVEVAIFVTMVLGLVAKCSLASDKIVSGPSNQLKNELRQEVNDSKDRQQMETIGVQDIKLGEYQDGKSLTDIHGNRVRLEQYILVPESNQIEILTYTKRDTGVDTLNVLYTLNKDIPVDVETQAPDIRKVGELDPKKWESGALADLTAPEFYCKDINSSASNDKGDSVAFGAQDGSLYQVKNFEDELGLDYKYDVLYKNSFIKVNEITKVQLTQTGGTPGTTSLGTMAFYLPKYLSTNNELSKTITFDPSKKDGDSAKLVSLDDYQTWAHTSGETYWDGTKIDQNTVWDNMTVSQLLSKKLDWTTKITFADGTYLSQREAWLKDSGEELTVGSYFSLLRHLTPGNWASKISELNHESIWTATEFSDRTIDVIWSPSIFVKVVTQDVSNNK